MKNITKANIISDTKVLVRIDMDVPFEGTKIRDTSRLDRALPTINYILEKGGYPVLMGHIGRPKGKYVEELTTKKLVPYFDENIGKDNYQILENLRFDPREKSNDKDFAKELAEKADIYVNESFATCHRKHTSIVGISKLLPSFAGLRVQEEIDILGKVLQSPETPVILIVGGAKIESKKPVIDSFLSRADKILLGGKLGLTWTEEIPENVILPIDYSSGNFDIGPETIEKYKEIINSAKTIVWAGPMGMFEKNEYFLGTKEIAHKIADSTDNKNCFSVVGGGDTVAAIKKANVENKISFVSTGGSAMLEFLAKGTLPGIEVLK